MSKPFWTLDTPKFMNVKKKHFDLDTKHSELSFSLGEHYHIYIYIVGMIYIYDFFKQF